MFFNLFLIILFAGSVGVLWHRISEKIPELVAIPDDVIVARLHEDSARVRIFLLHARTFWREPWYRESFWHFCEKICYRAHIVLLRMDNGLMILAKKIRSYGDMANAEANGNEVIVDEEKKEMAYEAIAAVPFTAAEPMQVMLASMPEPPRTSMITRAPATRIQEVRKRRSKTTLPI